MEIEIRAFVNHKMENGIRVETKHCKSPHPANGEGNVQKGLCSYSKYNYKYN